ncbi:MAG: Holliday junction branch migration protein RuvA [Primorskyibacter sp.]
MIGKLTGRVDYKALDHLLIDVRGVGYIVYCSDRVMAGLPGPGAPVSLFTDMIVREDLMQLFGFPSLVEKEWHRLLMSVQGIGAKAALAIMGALGPEGVSRAVALGDWNAVKAAKGVGPKTAQRVVNELKDKAPAIMAMGAGATAHSDDSLAEDMAMIDPEEAAPAPRKKAPTPTSAAASQVAASRAAQADALSALGNLGYAPGEAAGAVAQAAGEAPDADTQTLIRAALRLLAPQG